MLYIHTTAPENCIMKVDYWFIRHKENSWFNTGLIKEIIKGIDKTEAVKDQYLESPIFGGRFMSRIKGLEGFVCYDEFWLRKDMENMGYIFEFCDVYCHNLYGVWINKVRFLDMFMRSRMRVLMEIGHPRFVSQAAETTLTTYIEEDFKNDLSRFRISEQQCGREFQFYWCGSVYAYIHFQTKLPSIDIVDTLPIGRLATQYYPTGHCMSIEGFYDRVKDMFK